MPGTRKSTLAKAAQWISSGSEPVLWVFGIAGTGKSSVMSSLLEILDNHTTRMAAFIRFDRAQFSDASLFVRALAYQLAAFDSRLGHAISKAFLDRPQIINNSQLSAQFDVLIRQPLQKYPELNNEGPIVVLVDGLDECINNDMRKQMLDLLLNFNTSFKRLPFLRIIISSRPEEDILLAFLGCAHIHPFRLDTTSPETIADIEFFITNKLSESQNTEFQALCEDANAVSKLSTRASGLFIWASIVVAFILALPHKRLRLVLDTDIPSSALGALDTLYRTALSSVVADIAAEDIQSGACAIFGVIMVLSRLNNRDKLTMPTLIILLARLDVIHAKGFLDKLRSIMITNDDDKHGVQLMHKSLDDFLTDKSRCGEGWYVCLQDQSSLVVSACLSELSALFKDHPNVTWGCPWPPLAAFTMEAVYWIMIGPHIKNIPSQSVLYNKLQHWFSIYLLRWAWWFSFGNPGLVFTSFSVIGWQLQLKIIKPSPVSMSATTSFLCTLSYPSM
jgi:hypothetical protein